MSSLFDKAESVLGRIERGAQDVAGRVEGATEQVRDVIARTERATEPPRPGPTTDPAPELRAPEDGGTEAGTGGIIERLGGLPVVAVAVIVGVLITQQ